MMVQMVAFSDPNWQLPRYLDILHHAGLREVQPAGFATSPDGRLWRTVPNRKWYACHKGKTGGAAEVVLFHARS